METAYGHYDDGSEEGHLGPYFECPECGAVESV